jgi:hypothetical protein
MFIKRGSFVNHGRGFNWRFLKQLRPILCYDTRITPDRLITTLNAQITFSDEIPETSSQAIELSDKRQIKKSSKTLILDACNLSDFQIICISSVCSDLRFYDYSTMGKCNLRLYLRNFPSPIVAIHFYCSNDSEKSSKLIFGDMVGSVRVIDFMKDFKFRHGSMLRQVSYQDLMKVTMIDVCSI